MIEDQFHELQARHAGATMQAVPGVGMLVRVPNYPTGPGWSHATTTVSFVAPTGYPYSNPDCFYADPALTLAGGRPPANSAINQIPGCGEQGLWFSWHLTQPWNPNADTLLTWLSVIGQRFAAAR